MFISCMQKLNSIAPESKLICNFISKSEALIIKSVYFVKRFPAVCFRMKLY